MSFLSSHDCHMCTHDHDLCTVSSHGPHKSASHLQFHFHISPILTRLLCGNTSEVVPSFPVRADRSVSAVRDSHSWTHPGRALLTANTRLRCHAHPSGMGGSPFRRAQYSCLPGVSANTLDGGRIRQGSCRWPRRSLTEAALVCGSSRVEDAAWLAHIQHLLWCSLSGSIPRATSWWWFVSRWN